MYKSIDVHKIKHCSNIKFITQFLMEIKCQNQDRIDFLGFQTKIKLKTYELLRISDICDLKTLVFSRSQREYGGF